MGNLQVTCGCSPPWGSWKSFLSLAHSAGLRSVQWSHRLQTHDATFCTLARRLWCRSAGVKSVSIYTEEQRAGDLMCVGMQVNWATHIDFSHAVTIFDPVSLQPGNSAGAWVDNHVATTWV